MMDYFLNTEAYAAFCVNKEKPELGCNGSCQMEKAMKNMDHEQEQPVTSPETSVVVYTIPEVFQSEFKNTTVAKDISYPKYREYITNSILNKLLRPPQSLS